jgi:molecular chaperone GrpE
MNPEEELKTQQTPDQEPETPPGEAPAGEDASLPESPEELRLLLEDARTKADENRDALLRARAEVDNLRKRNERDVENAHKFGT